MLGKRGTEKRKKTHRMSEKRIGGKIVAERESLSHNEKKRESFRGPDRGARGKAPTLY